MAVTTEPRLIHSGFDKLVADCNWYALFFSAETETLTTPSRDEISPIRDSTEILRVAQPVKIENMTTTNAVQTAFICLISLPLQASLRD